MEYSDNFNVTNCKSLFCVPLIRLIVCVLLLHHSSFLLSQVKVLGIPNIESFTKKDYKAGTSNWSIVSMNNGNILVANNSGFLDYNGVKWNLKTLPNRSIARSICLAESGRIYVGGQDEIGYYMADSIGNLRFQSIRQQIPSIHLPLEDVWECRAIGNKVCFRSTNKVFIYEESIGFEVIDPKGTIISIDDINGSFYYTDLTEGIVSVDSQIPLQLEGETLIGTQIVSILAFGEQEMLILTEQDGAYLVLDNIVRRIKETTFDIIKRFRVNCAVAISNGQFAIGTQFGGIVIIDQYQEVISIYDKSNNLINNDVRSLSTDAYGNLWAGTNNGISKLDLAGRIRVFSPDGDEQSSTYDIACANENLYIGTNTGLYRTGISKAGRSYMHDGFTKVPGSDGQIWGINVIDDKVLIGHNDGPYLLEDGSLRRLADRPGVWKFISTKDEYLYVGTYTGVDIYKWHFGVPIYYKSLEGFTESSRIIISVRENEIWVSHPYRGVYRLTHNDQFENVIIEKYGEAGGLPSGLGNYIFDINGIPTVTASTGVYSFDRVSNVFKENTNFHEIDSDEHNVRRLLNEGYYIAEHEVGKLNIVQESKDTIREIYPELNDVFVGGFENLYELDSNTILICTDKGVILYNSSNIGGNIAPNVEIHEVKLATRDNQILHAGYGVISEDNVVLQSNENAIRFLFNSFNHSERSKFRYRLIGLEEEWSDWTNELSKEYNNLSHGSYSFDVQTADMYGTTSVSKSYSFEIKAPWYLSSVAKLLVIILFVGGLLLIYIVPQKKYKTETKVLQLANQQSEEEIEILKSQQLESEIVHKNAQLASSTLHLVQKNETINKIRTEIESVRKTVKDPEAKKELKKVISVLSDDERLEDDWESFSVHFDQVHSDFLKRLKEQYPEWTRKDRKMAAYLRMNLSTKEIAPLLGISARGVEIGRYRLRKKMELDTGIKLRKYMVEF